MSKHDDDWIYWLLIFSGDSKDDSNHDNDAGSGCGCLLVLLAIIILFFT